MGRIFGFILALVVLGGVVYFLFPYLQTSQKPVEVAQESEAMLKSASVSEETDAYLIDIKYPQFGTPAIDADIKSKIDVAVDEFKAIPAAPHDSSTTQYSFDGSFEDVYIGPDVISFVLILSQYTGGAHPMTILSGINYDRATSRQLLQQDAFTMLGLSAEEISAKATAELKAKLGEGMLFEEGASSNPENFSSFFITDSRVTFIFQPYQVAAYAAGVQEVSFERKE